jgi:hypothetical protein
MIVQLEFSPTQEFSWGSILSRPKVNAPERAPAGLTAPSVCGEWLRLELPVGRRVAFVAAIDFQMNRSAIATSSTATHPLSNEGALRVLAAASRLLLAL